MLLVNLIKQKKLSKLSTNTWQLKRFLNLILALMLSSNAQAISITEVVDLAIENNLSIKIAEKDFNIKEQDQKVKISNFLPNLSVNANSSWNVNSERLVGDDSKSKFNSNGYTVSVSQDIINFSDIYSYKISDIDSIISELNIELEKQKTIEETASLYLNILKKKSEIKTLNAELRSSKILLKSVKKNIAVGNKPGFELYEIASKKEKLLASLTEERNNLLDLNNEIKSLAQSDFNIDHDIREKINSKLINNDKKEQLILKLIKYNIEIIKSKYEIIKEEIKLKESRSAYYPTLSANISYTYNKTTADNPSPKAKGITDNTVYSISLKIPVFSGGSKYFNYQKRGSELSKSKINHQDTINKSQQKLNSLIEGINTKYELLTILKKVVNTSKLSLSKTKKAYEMGARTITDVLTSETGLYQSIKNYNKTRYEYLIDLISLEKETGSLNIDFITSINNFMHKSRI